MIVLINGSFGSGKSTVARILRNQFAGSVLYDPEWAGLLLRHPARLLKLEGSGTDDFQDIRLWRRSVIYGARLFRFPFSGPLIVPMTFTERGYFDEVVDGLRNRDSNVRMFCLRASLRTIKDRLRQRGDEEDGWLARRIVECSVAHRDPHFGEPIETEQRSANDVAMEIAARIRGASSN